ncbi:hypothetical protein PV11_06163 [Exophiala sideris]|uniref:Peptidase S33 tripeptidyl aminopeptidase-like C-terminal domain-containing protein n=1 Tax=Exophiala sideris TaxID=1016849 RepID=A0A0D1W6A1_9EURO|nr:hypothetical protein PV11_06163 [Exophiala sideris]
MLRRRKNVLVGLDQWSTAFETFLDSDTRKTKDDVRAGQLLRIQHLAGFIHLSVTATDPETSYDKYLPRFQKIVFLSRILLDPMGTLNPTRPTMRKFRYEHGIIPSLYLVGYKCRDPIVRREAHRQLASLNTKEGVWDSDLMVKVVGHIIAVEECGPGQSGVQNLMTNAETYLHYFGPGYNLVSFDPRGVNNSGPSVDCFYQNETARTTFESLFFGEVTDASSTSLATQFYSAKLFGQWCTEAFSHGNNSGLHISTPAVAQDMLTFAQAEQRLAGKHEDEAEVWYYGMSYGTALGATFASLYPQNVGRVVLDGVIDAQDYYEGGWKANLYDTDAVLSMFPRYCYQAGQQNCSFWGPSEQNITDRINQILSDLQQHPIPVTGLQQDGMPMGLATYSDVKQSLLLGAYFPTSNFPSLADALTAVEAGDGSIVTDITSNELWGPDVNVLIKCVDSYGNNNLTTLDEYRDYVNIFTDESKSLGDTWANNAGTALCSSLNLDLPHGGSFPGPLPPSSNHTEHPILFVSNSLDPVAPIRNAHKMSRAFTDSTVLIQGDGIGHTAISNGGSPCLFNHVRSYLDSGNLPPANTTCQGASVPFRDS